MKYSNYDRIKIFFETFGSSQEEVIKAKLQNDRDGLTSTKILLPKAFFMGLELCFADVDAVKVETKK